MRFSLIWTWFLFLSLIRGLISGLIGFVVNHINLYLALVITLLPLLGILLPGRKIKINKYLILSSFFWIASLFSTINILKLVFIILGIVFLFPLIKETISSKYNFQSLPMVLILDFILRSVNYGQDLIIQSTVIGKIIASSIVIVMIYSGIKDDLPEEIERKPSEDVSSKISSILPLLIIFLTFLVYQVEFSSTGNMTQATGLSFKFSNLIYITITIAGFLSIQFYFKHQITMSLKFVVPIFVALVISTLFFPWYSWSVILLIIGLFAIQYSIFIQGINLHRVISNLNQTLSLGISYTFFLLLVFFGLKSENYTFIPILVTIIGLLTIYSTIIKTNIKIPEFTKIRSQAMYGIIIILLMLTPFLYSVSNNKLSNSDNLSIMTYNIHFGLDSDGFDNIDRVVTLVEEINPSIIAFQEVTVNSITNGFGNIYEKLKENLQELGYNFDYLSEGGKYTLRNLVFSKYPIIESKTTVLDLRVIYERQVLELTIDIDGQYYYIFATHITHVLPDESNPDRIVQLKQILKMIGDKLGENPVIFLGDFNSEPHWAEIQLVNATLSDAWTNTNQTEGLTWPSYGLSQRLDYIFYDPLLLNVTGCQLINTMISDHLPLICTFT